MKQCGEKRLAKFAAKVEKTAGKFSTPGTKTIAGFVVHYNPTGALAKVDGVRLRPFEGVVKATNGRAVLRFDEASGVTYDSKLAAPLLDEFEIPRDDQS